MASGVVSFNRASGNGTCSDNIKGQIYIRHCWEMPTHMEQAAGQKDRKMKKAI